MSDLLYRGASIGDSLVEALDALISDEKITPDLAYKVLQEVRCRRGRRGMSFWGLALQG